MTQLARLLQIMARLRDPDTGCPWDLKQDFNTIAPHTLEEAYEVVDAIERGDFGDLREELGDLLFQVVYYAQMARERGLFDLEDIAETVNDKLVRRHPHVFGEARYQDDAQLHEAWEAEKARERQARAPDAGPPSVMAGIARALPELSRAAKLQRRASRVGFDWPEAFETVFKIEEELAEVQEELAEGGDQRRLEEEIGDLLFAVVNLARHLELDPEQTLRRANQKFERRFRAIEARLARQGRRPQQCELEELDALWEAVKREER
jgi:MazG family protein